MSQESGHTAREGTFRGAGDLEIFFRSWRPASAPRAVVVIVHGFNSHSGYYQWAAEQLTASGFAVYALDLRGRGKSDGERFYVSDVAEYVGDVANHVILARTREPDLPVFLLGHSAGGVISCLYAIDHQTELAGLICESFAYQVPAPNLALAVLKALSRVTPHAHLLRLKNADFSRDPALVRAMNADPLIAHESQPAQTVAELVRATERLEKEFRLITLPVLILHGTLDRVTKPSGSQVFFDTAASVDRTLFFYDGHFHDLLNDIDRELVIADIMSWIDTRIAAVRSGVPVLGAVRETRSTARV